MGGGLADPSSSSIAAAWVTTKIPKNLARRHMVFFFVTVSIGDVKQIFCNNAKRRQSITRRDDIGEMELAQKGP